MTPRSGSGKRGPLSVSERRFIAASYTRLTASEIAEQLNRAEHTIVNYVEKELGQRVVDGITLPDDSQDIQNRPYWNELRSQFSDEELRLFAFHWKEVRNQFGNDIFYTEELQIIELCRLELLANRVLREQQRSTTEIASLELALQDEVDLTEKKAKLNRLDSLRASLTAFLREYRDLYDKKTKTLQELKATRRERIKRIEDQRQTLQGWMSELCTDASRREAFADFAEKHRLASEKEYKRLTAYHEFADGIVDRVLLTPESELLSEDE